MIRKDYIQRYFDEMAKMLAKILFLKQNNEPDKIQETLNDFANDFLEINLKNILETPKDKLIDTLKTKHDFDLTKFKLLEELLFQKFLLTPTDISLRNSTLEVINYIVKNDSDFSVERHQRFQELSKLSN
ncbi:MAG: hypothetical protein COA31_000535 [Flavobacteriales bacterium]|nr:hypothetical protein [Flavobacteriales bacterium]